MTRDAESSFHEVGRWVSDSINDAQMWVPMLVGLPVEEMHRELSGSSRLRTIGVMKWLLTVAGELVERAPLRASELTAVVLAHLSSIVPPAGGEAIVSGLQAQAMRDRADALRRLNALTEARQAVAGARAAYALTTAPQWFLATVDLVEAPILFDCGDHAAAMEMVRRAAGAFVRFRDAQPWVQAVMHETWMLWTSGAREAVPRLWAESFRMARACGDAKMSATLEARIGLFELEHGDAARAAEHLAVALDLLDASGLGREAARTRRYMAETAAERGRMQEAISELYKVHAELLALSAIRDAAVVAARIAQLLLLEGRGPALVHATETFARSLSGRMPEKTYVAIEWMAHRARTATLTPEDARAVERYFDEAPENLELQPFAWARRA